MHLGLLLDVSESMGDDIQFTRTAAIKFLNTLTDAVDITVVDFDTEVRARALRPERVRAADRAHPRSSKADGLDGAVRRHRRVPRRRRRAGRPQDHAAVHRRRRYAELDVASAS